MTPEYCKMMARYNRWQNGVAIRAAGDLGDAERRRERGAFFGSLQGTFSHLLWGDLMWMSRFDGGTAPECGIAESAHYSTDWDQFVTARDETDQRILGWANGLGQQALAGDLVWYSGALERQVTRPIGLCIAHFFNHQTHHRGQIHAMLTAAGARTAPSDLFAMPDDIA
ncbi:DinB family protein [Roseovarius aquimarinus]|uniref:DinB family protein n=1 Tax=Roseovarius aquimarinus TaxID=1229156 RepID=A0ABW7I4Z9_9RHOB